MRNLPKNFSHRFPGKVWRIESEVNGQKLLLEVRDDTAYTTFFVLYDPFKHQLVGDAITLDESWWVGCTYFFGDIILFHTFSDTENPDKKNYLAYDIRSGEVLWEKVDIDIIKISDGCLTVRHSEGEPVSTMDLATAEGCSAANDGIGPAENKFIRFPFHYSPGSAYHKTAARFLTEIGIEYDSSLGVDYLEHEGWLMMSYYLRTTTLKNRLLVLDMDKKIHLQETLGKDLQGIADRPFFVYQGSLIFVKDSTDFFSYQLSL